MLGDAERQRDGLVEQVVDGHGFFTSVTLHCGVFVGRRKRVGARVALYGSLYNACALTLTCRVAERQRERVAARRQRLVLGQRVC